MQKSYFDKIIISDTSCLIALTNIGRLDILQELCRSVMITPEVAKEFGEPLPEWITVVAVSDSKKTEAFLTLHGKRYRIQRDYLYKTNKGQPR